MLKFKANNGQSLVEFAIILPILLLLLLGILEMGFMLNALISVQNASREGARMASVGNSDVQLQTHIQNISPQLDHTVLNLEVSPSEDLRNRGQSVTVRIEYKYHIINPLISGIIGNEILLHGQTIMRVE